MPYLQWRSIPTLLVFCCAGRGLKNMATFDELSVGSANEQQNLSGFAEVRSHSLGSLAMLLVARTPASSLNPPAIADLRTSLHPKFAPLYMLATEPKVTRDDKRNGLIIISSQDDALHNSTFIGPIHGLGDSNMGWADVAYQLHMSMPHIKFILPNAPLSPVTLNNGMRMPSWYDITSLDKREGQACDGIEDSRSTIVELIQEEVQRGIPLERIVVGGFSQGGAMSLYTGLQYPGQLAGIVCMSGYLAAAEKFKLNPLAAKTPVIHFHGADDSVVRIEWARESAARLRELGCLDYTLKEYAGMDHSASNEEINDLLEWLKERLP